MHIIHRRLGQLALLAGLSGVGAQAFATSPAPQTDPLKEGMHMAEAAQASPALAKDFARLTQSLKVEWLKAYGTTSPAVVQTVDEKRYLVFQGCKPHDCTSESYVVLVHEQSQKIAGGAFVKSENDGPRFTQSHVTWFGDTEWDMAVALGKYLF